MNRSTPITVLLALTLLGAALPGVAADAHADAGENADAAPGAQARSHAEQWLALKDLLKHGNVTGARGAFDEAFAPAAAHHPVAAQYATLAFDALAADGNTSSAAWAAWSQVVDKSTYAIAFANVENALAQGDVENATAWFGLLEAKFSKAGDLPASKRVFANLTADLAVTAGATLTSELTDLMQYKVHKEAAEVPGLLVADPVTAAKEAGEALGYFLTIERAYRAGFGDDAAADALAVLEDLVEHTLERDAEGAEHYALEGRNVAAAHAFATSATDRVDTFTLVKDALKQDKDVAAARAAYTGGFDHGAAEETHARILAALDDAEAALAANDTVAYNNARQIVEKSLFKVALDAFEHEALEGETDEALAAYRVLAVKFGWDTSTPGLLAAARMAAANAVNDDDLTEAKAQAFEAFFGKVRGEVEETFMFWDDNAKAQEKAIEGVVYYAPLKADVAERLGAEKAQELEDELVRLFDATAAGDRAAAEDAADAIEALLIAYENGGEEASPLDQVVSRIKGRVNMIAVEFREREAYLAAGDEKTAAEEVAEAKAFLAGARQEFETNVAAFEAAAGADFVADVNARLDRLGELIEAEESYETIHAETSALIGLFESVNGPAKGDAGADAPREAFGTSTLTLGAAELVEAGLFRVPVIAKGLPQDGVAYQFKLVAPAGVKIEDVRLELAEASAVDVAKDGASVRFNGAATKSLGDGEVFAEILFTVGEAGPGSIAFAFTVEEFADGAGKPWDVTFEGTTVSVADAHAAEAGKTADVKGEGPSASTPGPALGIALVALAGVALLARRREV